LHAKQPGQVFDVWTQVSLVVSQVTTSQRLRTWQLSTVAVQQSGVGAHPQVPRPDSSWKRQTPDWQGPQPVQSLSWVQQPAIGTWPQAPFWQRTGLQSVPPVQGTQLAPPLPQAAVLVPASQTLARQHPAQSGVQSTFCPQLSVTMPQVPAQVVAAASGVQQPPPKQTSATCEQQTPAQQRWPLPQALSSGLIGLEQAPVAGLQVPTS
jgi:hypothetical protein